MLISTKLRSRKKVYVFVIILVSIYVFYKISSRGNLEDQEKSWRRRLPGSPKRFENLTTVILPDLMCHTETLLVVIVHSQPSHIKARRFIRESWDGQLCYRLGVSLFFLLREPKQRWLQVKNEIIKESEMFDDIILNRFMHFRLTNYSTAQSLLMLKLATNHCYFTSQYLLKVNDDVVFDLYKIVEMLRRNGSSDLLMGELNCGARPERDSSSERFVSHRLYPETKFPNYLSGWAYLMSMEVAKKLYEVAQKTPIFRLEDVYLTGICADIAKIKPQHSALFLKRIKSNHDMCLLRESYAFHNTNETAAENILNFMLGDDDESCIGSEPFSSAKWIWSTALKVKNNPFSYRKICK